MPGPIIIPLDRSAFAEEALPLATSVGRWLKAPLEFALVHFAPPMLPEGAPGAAPSLDKQFRAEEQAYLDQQQSRLEEQTGLPVTSVMLDGPVAAALMDHARARGARLVVMTTHGRGGMSRLFLGSVADSLLRGLHCPMLLAHGDSEVGRPGPGERSRVLIPLDGSALAESIIDQVLALFDPAAIVLELVQVVTPQREFPAASDAPLTIPSRTEELLLAAYRYLHAVAGRLRKLGLRVQVEARISRSVPKALLDYAEGQTDLIAIATRGLGGLERLLLGSVADKVLRGTRVPLLAWNPPGQAASDVLLRTAKAAAEPSAIMAYA